MNQIKKKVKEGRCNRKAFGDNDNNSEGEINEPNVKGQIAKGSKNTKPSCINSRLLLLHFTNKSARIGSVKNND